MGTPLSVNLVHNLSSDPAHAPSTKHGTNG